MAFAPPPYQSPRRPGGLPVIGTVLLFQALALVAVLAYDLNKAGSGYLPTALGFSYQRMMAGPAVFGGASAAYLVVALVTAFRAFAGAAWVRGAAVALTGYVGYASATRPRISGAERSWARVLAVAMNQIEVRPTAAR
ncbi:hypothetical protein ACWEO1_15320, partial [Kitasatospora cineracea]